MPTKIKLEAEDGTQLAPDGARVALYCRISSDRRGLEIGVENQENELRKRCADLGWNVVAVYVDNDVSASRYRKKDREGFDRMLADGRSGKFTHSMAWLLDRFTREPRILEDLIDWTEATGIGTSTVGGVLDLATPEGRLQARVIVNLASYESEIKRKRLRLRYAGDRENGTPHWSRRPFGFEFDGTHRTAEADLLREAADRFVAGQTSGEIARWLNSTDLPDVEDDQERKAWNPRKVTQLLGAGRNAALYERSDGTILYDVEAAWLPIVDRQTFDLIRARLSAQRKALRNAKTSVEEWSLLGFIRCDLCGCVLRSRIRSGRRQYVCAQRTADPLSPSCGGVAVAAIRAEEVAEAVAVNVLADENERQRLYVALGDEIDATALRDQLSKIDATMESVENLLFDPNLPQKAKDRNRSRYENLSTEAAAIRATLASVSGESPLVGLPTDREALDLFWSERTGAQKRPILEAVLASVRITATGYSFASGARGRRFDPSRVKVTTRADAAEAVAA